ncbi:MAG: hypothetical protein H6729_02995 [Deltaproteobacteria bacterium]|nr:hypothetical protein [Deltaproteobacteria bacterium]
MMNVLSSTLLWGTVAGVIHFVVVGALYGNPFVDRLYRRATESEPGVRRWASRRRYMLAMFAGTQVEVYFLALAYFWLRPAVADASLAGTLSLGTLLAAVRVYPRFWNMWIQSTYPRRLLAVEVVNGTVGTVVIVLVLHFLAQT